MKLKTDALYRDITEINMTGISEVPLVCKYKKGDWRWWKFLGLIPLIPYKVKSDLYRDEYDLYDSLKTLERKWYEYGEFYHFIRDGKLYHKATVDVRHLNRDNNEHYTFPSDAEALKLIDEIKKNCKACGNILRYDG